LMKCPFFNNLNLPATVEVLKKTYCKGTYERCERFRLRTAGKEVPKNLWPNGETGN